MYLTQMGAADVPRLRAGYFRRRVVFFRFAWVAGGFLRRAFFTASSQSPSTFRCSGSGPRGRCSGFSSVMLSPIFGARCQSCNALDGIRTRTGWGAHPVQTGIAFAITPLGRTTREKSAIGCGPFERPAGYRRTPPRHSTGTAPNRDRPGSFLTRPFLYVSRKHLHRYLSEFEFRYNTRVLDDGARTMRAIRGAEGKRLMVGYNDPQRKRAP